MTYIQSKLSLYSILFTYFINNFALAVAYPVFTPLFLDSHVKLLAAPFTFFQRTILLSLLIAAFPLAQFFGSPIIGELSDRFGRKKAFCVTILGNILGSSLMAISITINSLSLLFFSRLISGLFAGNLTVCLATIADMKKDKTARTQYFGLMTGIGGLSFILAIVIGGSLSNPSINIKLTPAIPFWITAALFLIDFFLILAFFQETHPTTPKTSIKFFSGMSHIFTSIRVKEVRKLYLVFFFLILCWSPAMQFLVLFLSKKYQSTQSEIMWMFISIGFTWSISNLLISRYLCSNFTPFQVLRISLFLSSVIIPFFLLIDQKILFFILFNIVVCCIALSWTNTLAAVSLKAPASIQGSILGINQSMGSLAAAIGPILGAFAIGFNFHLIYVFAALSSFCAFIIFILKDKNKTHHSNLKGYF